jgi:6,7-dimethyl-8-ribityllumazine synthase
MPHSPSHDVPHGPDVTPTIAVISSMWHAELVARARLAFVDTMVDRGWPRGQLHTHDVPGAFEIPLLAQTLARSGQVAAVVACALVVDGGIYRHDFVAQAVVDGLMRVQLDTGIPVFSVVLTPQAFHEHPAHQQFFRAHLVHKGEEAARACLHVLARRQLSARPLDGVAAA